MMPAAAIPLSQRKVRNSQCIGLALAFAWVGVLFSGWGGFDGMAGFYWKHLCFKKPIDSTRFTGIDLEVVTRLMCKSLINLFICS